MNTPADEQELARLRFVIWIGREMRKHYERWDQYRMMVFAEEQIRSAKRRYRAALG